MHGDQDDERSTTEPAGDVGDNDAPGATAHEQLDADEHPASSDNLGFKVLDRRFWAEDTDEESAEPRDNVPSYVAQLQNQVQQKDKQLREYIAAYKQEVVENLEQTKERLQRDADQRLRALRGELATPMLEVFDALERSLAAARANADPAALRQGYEMLHKLMTQKLGSLGLERIPSVGEMFDPHLHEALAVCQVDDADQNNRVTAEFSPGFSSDGRVMRPAKVQVGKLEQS